MKTNMFKKIFALVLALSMITIPSLSFATETAEPTTLYQVQFPNVGTVVTDGTIADVNAAIQTANNNNSTATVIAGSSLVENGAAATYSVANNWMTIKPATDGTATQTDVVLGASVNVGEVTFTYTFENNTYNSRRLTINDTKIVGSGNTNAGYMLMQVAEFPFEDAIKTVNYGETWYAASPSYNMATVKIVASREDSASTWAVSGYHGETLLFTGTLPAEPITKFGIYHQNASSSQTTRIYQLAASAVIGEEPEPEVEYEDKTFYKVLFPNVGTAVTDGAIADVNAAITTAYNNNSTSTVIAGSSLVENGAAATYSVASNWMTIKPATDGTATQTDVVLGASVNVGEVTFTYTFENNTYNSRRLTINDTKIVGSGNTNAGYMLMQVAEFPFEDAIKTVNYGETWYAASPSYNMATVKIVASREDSASTWAVSGYHGETLLFTGTLPAEPITKFGIYHQNASSSQTTRIYQLVAEGRVPVETGDIVPDDPNIETNDETVLCDLNENLLTADSTYATTADLNAALKEAVGATFVEKADAANTYSVNGSKRLIAQSTSNSMSVELQLDEPKNKGEITFNYAIDLTTNNNRAFTVNGVDLVRTGNANITTWFYQVDDFPFEESVKTVNEWGTWYTKTGAVISLKVVVSRQDEVSRWMVKGYDGETLVFTGSLPAEPISKFGLSTDSTGTTGFVIHSLSAIYSANGPLKSVKVVNANDETIEDLKDGGDIKCVVDVKQAGGILYAAIYSNGYKLLAVKSATVTEAGEVELPFENVAADATQHMKLFYWSNQFKPLIGFMDPLNPMD